MPIGIEDGRHRGELGDDQINAVLGQTTDEHLNVEHAGCAPLGEHPTRDDVEILKALENPRQYPRVGLGRDA
jgi:hypothetical protein